jgi:MFS transporter, DHA1 family, inner membrane transport protein
MPRSNAIPPARLPLLALALASFGIGTTEYVIMGLLPSVAQDLRARQGSTARSERLDGLIV